MHESSIEHQKICLTATMNLQYLCTEFSSQTADVRQSFRAVDFTADDPMKHQIVYLRYSLKLAYAEMMHATFNES
jgi:hypothetical protein